MVNDYEAVVNDDQAVMSDDAAANWRYAVMCGDMR